MRLIGLQRILSFYEPLIVELRAISLLKNFVEELNRRILVRESLLLKRSLVHATLIVGQLFWTR